MKNKLFIFIMQLVLVLVGCKESTLTDPLQDLEFQKLKNNHDPSIHTGTILFDRMFRDPYPVMNSFYIIKGQIQYRHSVRIPDPIPPNYQFLISLDLSVVANFTDFCTVCGSQTTSLSLGTISNETKNIIYMSEDGGNIYLLEKSFAIQGRKDRLVLMCRFNVTTDSIELNAMWLELPDINDVSANPTRN
jgi:hypothetical protein